jgi:hypothetical protein
MKKNDQKVKATTPKQLRPRNKIDAAQDSLDAQLHPSLLAQTLQPC